MRINLPIYESMKITYKIYIYEREKYKYISYKVLKYLFGGQTAYNHFCDFKSLWQCKIPSHAFISLLFIRKSCFLINQIKVFIYWRSSGLIHWYLAYRVGHFRLHQSSSTKKVILVPSKKSCQNYCIEDSQNKS